MLQPGPTPRQLQGSAAQTPTPAGAPPSRVPLPVIKLEVEDAVLFGCAEPGHRQRGCSHRAPDAVISCRRQEGLTGQVRRQSQAEQTDPKGHT